LNGYALIPVRLSLGKSGAKLSQMQQRKRNIAIGLANRGYTEVINYPFTNQEMIDLLGFTGDRAKSFRILNPMSEQAPLLRTHLIPGLLSALQLNLGRGSKNVALFEIGSVFRNIAATSIPTLPPTNKRPNAKSIAEIYQSVPKQMVFVGGVMTGERIKSGWQGVGEKFVWSDAVAEAIAIIESTGNSYELSNTDLAPWHPGRCAEIKVAGKAVAHAGELHPRVCAKLNLPERTCVFAGIISELPLLAEKSPPKIWSFPAVVQDVALLVDSKVSAHALKQSLIRGAGELLETIDLFDRYDQVGNGKISLAFTLTFRASDRTLTSEEVAKFRDAAILMAAKDHAATLRG
jgi:phenylalanyl-tRNA synthetase beta chain